MGEYWAQRASTGEFVTDAAYANGGKNFFQLRSEYSVPL